LIVSDAFQKALVSGVTGIFGDDLQTRVGNFFQAHILDVFAQEVARQDQNIDLRAIDSAILSQAMTDALNSDEVRSLLQAAGLESIEVNSVVVENGNNVYTITANGQTFNISRERGTILTEEPTFITYWNEAIERRNTPEGRAIERRLRAVNPNVTEEEIIRAIVAILFAPEAEQSQLMTIYNEVISAVRANGPLTLANGITQIVAANLFLGGHSAYTSGSAVTQAGYVTGLTNVIMAGLRAEARRQDVSAAILAAHRQHNFENLGINLVALQDRINAIEREISGNEENLALLEGEKTELNALLEALQPLQQLAESTTILPSVEALQNIVGRFERGIAEHNENLLSGHDTENIERAIIGLTNEKTLVETQISALQALQQLSELPLAGALLPILTADTSIDQFDIRARAQGISRFRAMALTALEERGISPDTAFGMHYIALMESMAKTDLESALVMNLQRRITRQEAERVQEDFFASALADWIGNEAIGVWDAENLINLLGDSAFDTPRVVINASLDGGVGAGYIRFQYVPIMQALAREMEQAISNRDINLINELNRAFDEGVIFSTEPITEFSTSADYNAVLESIRSAAYLEVPLASKAMDIKGMVPFIFTDAQGNRHTLTRPLSIAEEELVRMVVDNMEGSLGMAQFLALIADKDQHLIDAKYNAPIPLDVVEAMLIAREKTPREIATILARIEGKTFREYFNEMNSLDGQNLFGDVSMSYLTQVAMPKVRQDADNPLDINFIDGTAFNGHGFRPIQLFEHLLNNKEMYQTVQAQLAQRVLAVFNNSDGQNNGTLTPRLFNIMLNVIAQNEDFIPSEYVVGRGPIAGIVSTTATKLDKKGGKIGVRRVTTPSGEVVFVKTIMEVAQPKVKDSAEGDGKGTRNQDNFAALGTSVGDVAQFFNTNNIVVDVNRLTPFLTELARILGNGDEAEGVRAIWSSMTPDLIRKPGVVKDGDAIEGAAGSTMFNFDAFLEIQRRENNDISALMERYVGENHTFLGVINLPERHRSRDFTPRKSVADEGVLERKGIFFRDPATLTQQKQDMRFVNMSNEEFEAFKTSEEFLNFQAVAIQTEMGQSYTQVIIEGEIVLPLSQAIQIKAFWEGRYQMPVMSNMLTFGGKQISYDDMGFKMDARKIMYLFGNNYARNMANETLISTVPSEDNNNIIAVGYRGMHVIGDLRIENHSPQTVVITPEIL
ncbi:MAG: hypothetical protein FWC85_04320, partial [Elusimicrobia bacterium]|nr:hypothetical protein [Elusimicrobiota bacterium]